MDTPVRPDGLTVAEAAQYLGIGRSSCYRLIAAGRIESVRFGRSRRVSLRYLERLMASGLKLDLPG